MELKHWGDKQSLEEIVGGGVGLDEAMKIMGLLSCKKFGGGFCYDMGLGMVGFAMILVFTTGHCIPFVLVACLELKVDID